MITMYLDTILSTWTLSTAETQGSLWDKPALRDQAIETLSNLIRLHHLCLTHLRSKYQTIITYLCNLEQVIEFEINLLTWFGIWDIL